MYFDSFNAAMVMGGHGVYVWSAYGICLIVLGLMLLAPGRRRQKVLRQVAGEQKRQQGSPMTGQESN